MKTLAALLLLALGFWTAMFFPPLRDRVPFWPTMMLASGLLAGSALVCGRGPMAPQFRFRGSDLLIGAVSAGMLYGIFWIGHFLATAIFPFAAGQIEGIYAIRPAGASWPVALLLFFWVGPAEEIFWRGFVQRRLGERFSPLVGFVLATALYTAVHIPSLNFMLIGAAGVAGAFWGLLYLTTGRLWPVILSHALWDVLIFILLPIC